MMSNELCRAFRFMIYPDSAPTGWLVVLRDVLQVRAWISPLHEPDKVDETALIPYKEVDHDSWEYIMEATRKPHYHGVIAFDGKKSYKQVKDFLMPIKAKIGPESMCCIRGNMRTAVRYLIHADDKTKQQWPNGKHAIICVNDATVDQFFDLSDTELDLAIATIRNIVKQFHISEISQLCDYLDRNHPDLAHVLNHKCYFQMCKYIDSRRYSKAQTGQEKVDNEEIIINPETGEVMDILN